MIVEVKVPQLSESVAEATLLDWHKKEGEAVSRDENLIDIETDKVVLELPAPADGVLVKIIRQSKDSVGSGEVIAQIDTEGKAAAAPSPKKEPVAEKPKAAPPVMPAVTNVVENEGVRIPEPPKDHIAAPQMIRSAEPQAPRGSASLARAASSMRCTRRPSTPRASCVSTGRTC